MGLIFLFKKVNLLICYSLPSVLVTVPITWRLINPRLLDLLAFKAYILALILFSSCIPTISLIVLNILSLFKFKRVMKEKKKFSNERRRIDKANVRFTRLVVSLGFICIVTRVFEAMAYTFDRVRFVFGVSFSQQATSLIDFLFEISSFLLIASYSLDTILYFVLDKQLRRIIRRILSD